MFKLETVWPEWHIVEQLGQGASGSVYMARRETMGKTFYCAVKIIKIPQEPTEAENLRGMGLDDDSVRKYFAKKAREYGGFAPHARKELKICRKFLFHFPL